VHERHPSFYSGPVDAAADRQSSRESPRPRSRVPALGSLLTTAALALAAAPHAARADEDDWRVSARAGLANIVADGRDPMGLGLGGEVQYGLDDAWALRLSVAGAAQRVDAKMDQSLPGGTIWSYSAFAGLGYTMDVLRLLPTFAVGVGVLGARGAVKSHIRHVGIQVGLGADYLVTPRFAFGVAADYVFAPFDLFAHVIEGTQIPQAFALSARATWTLQ